MRDSGVKHFSGSRNQIAVGFVFGKVFGFIGAFLMQIVKRFLSHLSKVFLPSTWERSRG
nr:MAG TPA: hypothetical protein [Caudoviricetes sp.]DAU51170.1 MAG TPA: hypothetical protein [Caudoviricetes sp.]